MNHLRSVRQNRGLSQRALATKAGVAVGTIVRIEAGKGARAGTKKALAKALRVPQKDIATLLFPTA